MEAQLYPAQKYSMTQSAVLFLMVVGSYVQASSYGQTGYMEKYITKTYFEKYDSLMNLEFDNFIANEIRHHLCKVVERENFVTPKLSHLRRSIIGEGSHRRLSSSIVFKLQPELKSWLTAHACEIIIIESLPPGVFADPFELQHLVQRGVFSSAAVFGDTNLELPSFRSNLSAVEIIISIASKVMSRYTDDLAVYLEVPLHARYQPLGHDFSRVEFGQPHILIGCSLEGNVLNRTCVFMPTGYISDNKTSPATWEIPCGIKEHTGVVSAVTFGFAIVCTLLIVLTSVLYSDCGVSSKLKNQ